MEKFNQIAANIFKMPMSNIKDSLTEKEIPNWDSMNYLFFIAELEKEYNVSFDMDDVLNAKSLGDIKKMLLLKRIKI
ncbi:MAG: acyl carrier protein [bacterium]|nr:acyl carrier protein [bacterium]